MANAPPRPTSAVRYAGDDDAAAAAAVAVELGNLPVEQSASAAPGRVEVLLGTDFSATATPTPPAAAPAINARGVPCID